MSFCRDTVEETFVRITGLTAGRSRTCHVGRQLRNVAIYSTFVTTGGYVSSPNRYYDPVTIRETGCKARELG